MNSNKFKARYRKGQNEVGRISLRNLRLTDMKEFVGLLNGYLKKGFTIQNQTHMFLNYRGMGIVLNTGFRSF